MIKKAEDNELMEMIQLLLKIDKKCDNLDDKYEKQNAKFDNLDEKFNAQNTKFDEIKNEIEKRNVNFDKQIDEMHARFDKTEEKIVALVNEKFDRQKNKVDENYKSKMGVENSRKLSLIHI